MIVEMVDRRNMFRINIRIENTINTNHAFANTLYNEQFTSLVYLI